MTAATSTNVKNATNSHTLLPLSQMLSIEHPHSTNSRQNKISSTVIIWLPSFLPERNFHPITSQLINQILDRDDLVSRLPCYLSVGIPSTGKVDNQLIPLPRFR